MRLQRQYRSYTSTYCREEEKGVTDSQPRSFTRRSNCWCSPNSGKILKPFITTKIIMEQPQILQRKENVSCLDNYHRMRPSQSRWRRRQQSLWRSSPRRRLEGTRITSCSRSLPQHQEKATKRIQPQKLSPKTKMAVKVSNPSNSDWSHQNQHLWSNQEVNQANLCLQNRLKPLMTNPNKLPNKPHPIQNQSRRWNQVRAEQMTSQLQRRKLPRYRWQRRSKRRSRRGIWYRRIDLANKGKSMTLMGRRRSQVWQREMHKSRRMRDSARVIRIQWRPLRRYSKMLTHLKKENQL